MQSYLDKRMTFSEHFSELYKIIRLSALGVAIISFFLSFYIDDLMSNWLNSLSLDQDNFLFSVYSPYDWIDTKWAPRRYMEPYEDCWIYSGSAKERLWNKSAIGRRINNNDLLLSPAEVIFCCNHRHLDWPSENWLEKESEKNPDFIF